METVSGYTFRPTDLKVPQRQAGLAAFMRIRNGADFVEATIRSHLEYFDEIVAVYNQCTDATPQVLARLEQEIGPKLRVFHYMDRVYPPGSRGHAETPAESPSSMVTYSNFALAMTTRRTVTKLDDDQVAIASSVARIVADLRARDGAGGIMHCFSGVNLFRRPGGGLGIPARDPLSGGGEIGFFDVSDTTFFTHDPRFERAPRFRSRRVFCGFHYWHFKYMKTGGGFANYELESNPDSRFAKRKAWFEGAPEIIDLAELKRRTRVGALKRAAALLSTKRKILVDRADALAEVFPEDGVHAALRRTVAAEFVPDIA